MQGRELTLKEKEQEQEALRLQQEVVRKLSSDLVHAVRFNQDDVLLQQSVAELLLAGAQLDQRSESEKEPYTALQWAVKRDKPFVLEACLQKFPDDADAVWRTGGCGKTPARLACDEGKWECLKVIGQYAYWPHINGKSECLDNKVFKDLVRDKEIIFEYICMLPPDKKWEAICNGLNSKYVLGQVNQEPRSKIPVMAAVPGIGRLFNSVKAKVKDTDTTKSYQAEEQKMRDAGYPDCLNKNFSLPSSQYRSSAPQPIPPRPEKAGSESVARTPDFICWEYDAREPSPRAPIRRSDEPSPTRSLPQGVSQRSIWYGSSSSGSSGEDGLDRIFRKGA